MISDERINRLIARRERLTNRRDERINYPAVDEIDAVLRQVPAGERQDVDRLLGRACPKRQDVIDYDPKDWRDLRGDLAL